MLNISFYQTDYMHIFIFILILLCESKPIRPDTTLTITLAPNEVRQIYCQMNFGSLQSLNGTKFEVTYYANTNGRNTNLPAPCVDVTCNIDGKETSQINSMIIQNLSNSNGNIIKIVCSVNDEFIIGVMVVGGLVLSLSLALWIKFGIKAIIKRFNIPGSICITECLDACDNSNLRND